MPELVVGILFGMALMAAVMYFFILPAQTDIFERMIELLERHRDQARHEANVFRRLVLPQYDKAENSTPAGASSSTPQPTGGQAATLNAAAPAQPIQNRRLPFRIRLKQQMKATNFKQQKTDALAAALAAQKPKETQSNVSQAG